MLSWPNFSQKMAIKIVGESNTGQILIRNMTDGQKDNALVAIFFGTNGTLDHEKIVFLNKNTEI